MTSEEENLKILLDSVRHKYTVVADVDNVLDNNLGVFLTLEAALAVGYISFLPNNFGCSQFWWIVSGVFAYLASMVCAFWAKFLQRKSYRYPFSVTGAKTHALGTTKDFLTYLIEEGSLAIEKNRKRRDTKKKLFSWSIRLLIVAVVLLLIGQI